MISAPLPDNERERLRWLQDLNILDTLEEQAYEDLTLLASQICQTPIALVSLIDQDRQWFKSHRGLDVRETPRDVAFCAHAILADDVFVVEDSAKDPRFSDNPLATGGPHVKFYAGAPLLLRPNVRVGTLCVIDTQARTISSKQRQALQALARQVVQLMELRLKVKELEHLDQVKDEFVSMVSHELRTPLTSVMGSLSLLYHNKAGNLPPTARDMVGVAHRNTERLLLIVNDILDVARLEAGQLELHLEPLDVRALVDQALELNRPYCQKCNVSAVIGDVTPVPPIAGDEQRLLQVLSNLLSNAAKFTRAGDVIEVGIGRKDNMAQITVTDHGPGIPPEQQQHLFARFRQLGHAGNQKQPGTGLGLSISRQIVGLHGGTLTCESVPGTHTTFAIHLPLARPAG